MAARKLRRWADARRYADAMVALDSADESGWQLRLAVPWAQGDTLAMQREAARVLARFPHPSVGLLNAVAYAGTTYGLGYVSRSGRELGVATLLDSVDVLYDTKADVFLRLGDVARARIYSDSVRRLLAGRRLGGPNEGYLLRILAFAQANLGDTAAARRTLARGLARDLAAASQADSLDVLSSGYVLGTYARLGEAETAVRWMEASLAAPVSGPVWSTARAYAIHAKLLVLHGTPAFARFLRAHPE